jgi:hypothetical protein
VRKEYVSLKENGVQKPLLNRPDAEDEQDNVRLTQTALEQVNTNKAFRAIYDFFASIRYRHILPQLVRDPKNFSPSPSKMIPMDAI